MLILLGVGLLRRLCVNSEVFEWLFSKWIFVIWKFGLRVCNFNFSEWLVGNWRGEFVGLINLILGVKFGSIVSWYFVGFLLCLLLLVKNFKWKCVYLGVIWLECRISEKFFLVSLLLIIIFWVEVICNLFCGLFCLFFVVDLLGVSNLIDVWLIGRFVFVWILIFVFLIVVMLVFDLSVRIGYLVYLG